MAITYGTIVSGTGTSIDLSSAAPSGSGGMLVLAIASELRGAVTDPSNWLERQDLSGFSSTIGLWVGTRASDGGASDTPTVVIQSTSFSAVLVRVTDGDAFDTSSGTTEIAAGATADFASVTVGEDNSPVLLIFSTTNNTSPAYTWPSGYLQLFANATSGLTRDHCLAIGYDLTVASGATGTLSLGISPDAGNACLAAIALSPAAAPPSSSRLMHFLQHHAGY